MRRPRPRGGRICGTGTSYVCTGTPSEEGENNNASLARVLDHSRLKMAHVELASIDVRELDGSARRGDAGVEQETPHS